MRRVLLTTNGQLKMGPLASAALQKENEESTAGGPIGALFIAIPVSLLLWGAAALFLLNIVH